MPTPREGWISQTSLISNYDLRQTTLHSCRGLPFGDGLISDVTSSKKKMPIDLNVMDFRQMFDAEEVSVCLNAFYEAGITDDIFALLYEANKTNVISVKTPN